MKTKNIINLLYLLLFNQLILLVSQSVSYIPSSSTNWVQLVSSSNSQFTGRNAHASCVFKGNLWLTGGRSDVYSAYNLISSYSNGDVWYSENGATWYQVTELKGDFYIQNSDVIQPGPIAPWYQRYGHSLDAIDSNGDGIDDYMILAGGYTPDPSNDVWITEDGITWIYCGRAKWAPRAWHATAIFHSMLYIMGGTPLNNEVWYLKNITRISRKDPLTRAMYMNYTYEIEWIQVNNGGWSPRVGMAAISHWYFNSSLGETSANMTERLLVIGGFGGYPAGYPEYNGYSCQNDVWMSLDGTNWTLIVTGASFGRRAWFGSAILNNSNYAVNNVSSYIFIVGGGNIGFNVPTSTPTSYVDVNPSYLSSNTFRSTIINTMYGYLSTYRSIDGVNWTQVNFEEGGGTTGVTQYSSQEWTKTVLYRTTNYLGMWGMTIEPFNIDNGYEEPNRLILIGGTKVDDGDTSDVVYVSEGGIFCDIKGVPCNYQGTCDLSTGACVCGSGYYGQHCQYALPQTASANHLTLSISIFISTAFTIAYFAVYL